VQKWIPKLVSKFQDNPMVNELGTIVLLGQVWVYTRKKRVLEEEERRTNLESTKSVETYCKCKNWDNMSLFIARVL